MTNLIEKAYVENGTLKIKDLSGKRFPIFYFDGTSLNHEVRMEIHKKLENIGYTDYENRLMAIYEAEQYTKQQEKPTKIQNLLENTIDWKEITNEIVKTQNILYDDHKIWWIWNTNKNKYEIVDATKIKQQIHEAIHNNDTLKPQIKSIIIEGIEYWARKKYEEIKKLKPTQIQFNNIIIDYETGEMIDANPKYFTTNPIPHEYTPDNQNTSTFDQYFNEWVGEEYSTQLLEIIGFSMAPTYLLHRIICLTGSGSNGKSVFCKIIRTIIGQDNVTNSELETIATNRFETSNLYKKLVCEIGETNHSILEKTGTLKRLSGGDTMRVEFKGKDVFSCENTAKIIISTNTLPQTTDTTDGFYRRWLLIDFPNKFEEKGDILSNIPEEEWNALATKAFFALKALVARKKFIFDDSIEEKKEKYEMRSNPIKRFISLYFDKNPNRTVVKSRFADEFESFCIAKGLRILNAREFNAQLRNLGYEWKFIKTKREDGTTGTLQHIIGLEEKSGLYDGRFVGEDEFVFEDY